MRLITSIEKVGMRYAEGKVAIPFAAQGNFILNTYI